MIRGRLTCRGNVKFPRDSTLKKKRDIHKKKKKLRIYKYVWMKGDIIEKDSEIECCIITATVRKLSQIIELQMARETVTDY